MVKTEKNMDQNTHQQGNPYNTHCYWAQVLNMKFLLVKEMCAIKMQRSVSLY